MKDTTKYIITSLIIIALIFTINRGISLGKSYINLKQIPVVSSDTNITIVQYIDSTKHFITNNNYKTISENTIINNAPIDTQALINDYFTQKIIKDDYQDSNISISILDTLFKNKLLGRTLTYQNLKPTTTITKTINNTILKPVSGIYAGVGYANGFTPNINYINKNFLIGTGAIFNNSKIQPYININFKIK